MGPVIIGFFSWGGNLSHGIRTLRYEPPNHKTAWAEDGTYHHETGEDRAVREATSSQPKTPGLKKGVAGEKSFPTSNRVFRYGKGE